MKENQRETLSMVLSVLIFAATFQVCFSATKQLRGSIKMQTKSPKRVGSSLVFHVEGDIYPNGFFYTSIYIGNPPKLYFLDIDTGSDLTWVQCAAAPSAKLLKAPHTPYKPNNNAVFCKDPLCASVNQPSGYPCKSPNDQCDYEVEYADYGSSLGVLVRDKVPFKFTNGSVSQPILAFGCGYDQAFSGPFSPPYVDGVLGLANGKSSIVSQLRNLGITRNVIGHCFSGRGGGFLFIGDDIIPSGTAWIPMLPNSLNHYLSGPVDLLFDGKTLGAKGLNIVFDSGSTYTYLNSQAYQATLSRLNSGLVGKPISKVADGNLPVCWKGAHPFRSVGDIRKYFSTLELSFTNAKNVRFVIQPEGYLILTSPGTVCLGILNSAEANLGNLNLIGDISFQDKLIIYDNERRMIGWAPSNCQKPPKF
ncbi:unnamed protein product [Ilex paraguariensis]|uniref:Aspartic proteinase Asp1 n=1 Tax=Ilex paraguariensis TaxID=185542 RepID=A0ABC8TLP4_9AQUA